MNPLKRLRPLIFILFFMSIALPKARGFAPAGATKGLSGRPLETFGAATFGVICGLNLLLQGGRVIPADAPIPLA